MKAFVKTMLAFVVTALFAAGCARETEKAEAGTAPAAQEAPAAAETASAVLSQPGVCLTFDDRNFPDWEAALPLFEKYNARVTFFVYGPIGEEEAARLKAIAAKGHAIGSHSLKHGVYYKLKQDGMTAKEFAETDALAQLDSFRKYGIDVTCYGCPNSSRDAELDELLKPHFRHVRTGIFPREGQRLCDMDNAFVPIDQVAQHFVLNGKGIDKYPENTDEMIDLAMERAAQRNELLVFYAHRITAEEINGNHVEPASLERLLKKGTEMGLRFYSFDELP